MKHCSNRLSEALSVSVCERVISACVCVVSERLYQHREQQRQVFGSADGQFVCGVVMNDFRDGVKRRTVLSQDELPITRLRELHVHEPVTAPADGGGERKSLSLHITFSGRPGTTEMCQSVETALYGLYNSSRRDHCTLLYFCSLK